MKKTLSISDEIINERIGVHYFKLEYEQKLRNILKEIKKENLLEKYNRGYSIVYYACIHLYLHRSLADLIR